MMIRRRLLDIAIPFPPDCLVHDWWLAIAAASEGAGGICLIDEPLIFYRQHDSNVIGIGKKLAPVRFSKVISSIKFKPNRTTNLAVRNYNKRFEMLRLDGYLNLNNLTSNDRLIIEQYKMVLTRHLQDGQNGFIKRLFCIPERLRYASMQGDARIMAEVVYWSLFPHR